MYPSSSPSARRATPTTCRTARPVAAPPHGCPRRHRAGHEVELAGRDVLVHLRAHPRVRRHQVVGSVVRPGDDRVPVRGARGLGRDREVEDQVVLAMCGLEPQRLREPDSRGGSLRARLADLADERPPTVGVPATTASSWSARPRPRRRWDGRTLTSSWATWRLSRLDALSSAVPTSADPSYAASMVRRTLGAGRRTICTRRSYVVSTGSDRSARWAACSTSQNARRAASSSTSSSEIATMATTQPDPGMSSQPF